MKTKKQLMRDVATLNRVMWLLKYAAEKNDAATFAVQVQRLSAWSAQLRDDAGINRAVLVRCAEKQKVRNSRRTVQ